MPTCPCCQTSFPHFVDFGVVRRPNAQCPGCKCLERHRLLWLYLQDRTNFFTVPQRVLHIAPEPAFQNAFRKMKNLTYVSADLHSPHAMMAMDITHIPATDASFDVVLYSHVFEHIPDDRAAMREIHRILTPEGWAILQVPMDSSMGATLEDPTVTAPEERQRLFGQSDHVWLYGRDYRMRLEHAGFEVIVDQFSSQLEPGVLARYGLLPEDIYFCRRADHAHAKATSI
jgi:SAM-dependent methyltransferase